MKATLADRIAHIKGAIANIRSLTTGIDRDEIARDPVRRAALERFFEIVSEASRYIPEDRRRSHPDVPWRSIADLGNRLRHGYDGIDLDVLLAIAKGQLGPLETAIDLIIAEVDDSRSR